MSNTTNTFSAGTDIVVPESAKSSIDQMVEIGNNLVEAVTSKPTFKEKLRSRKFWLAVVGVAVGVCGMIGFNDNTTAIVAFAILEILSVLGYCFTEGVIDAARIKEMLAAIGTIGAMLGNEELAKEEAEKSKDKFANADSDELYASETSDCAD